MDFSESVSYFSVYFILSVWKLPVSDLTGFKNHNNTTSRRYYWFQLRSLWGNCFNVFFALVSMFFKPYLQDDKVLNIFSQRVFTKLRKLLTILLLWNPTTLLFLFFYCFYRTLCYIPHEKCFINEDWFDFIKFSLIEFKLIWMRFILAACDLCVFFFYQQWYILIRVTEWWLGWMETCTFPTCWVVTVETTTSATLSIQLPWQSSRWRLSVSQFSQVSSHALKHTVPEGTEILTTDGPNPSFSASYAC